MLRILVVEDNPLSHELIRDWLEVHGYEVVSAATLGEAFAAVEHVEPDAVLLDVQLGREDGLSLAEWMRRQSALRHIPIIAVTAHAMMVEKERILRAGCSSSIAKPIEFWLLREELEKWLTIGALMKRSFELDDEIARPSLSELQRKGAGGGQ